jgi:hypothetical protein
MNTAIKVNQNDAGILINYFCRDESGSPINLSQFSVDFEIYNAGTLINSGRTVCTKPDAVMGIAEYNIDSLDTATVGVFQGKLILQNGSSEVRNIGGIPFQVLDVF